MRIISLLVVWLWLASPTAGLAAEIKPLGLALAQTTRDQVASLMAISGPAQPFQHKPGWSFLVTTGTGLLPGSQSDVVFFFDATQVLRGVSVRLDKSVGGDPLSAFHRLSAQFEQQFALVKKETPVFGDTYALFRADNAIIELDAPYLDLLMTISYFDSDFARQFMGQR